jgi:hypothetical protein
LGGALLLTAGGAWGNGTETLGPPSIAIASGTGVAVGGIGLEHQPANVSVTVPAGATIKQVLLYWEGFEFTNVAGDNTLKVNGSDVTGTLIGGPTFFFERAYSSAFRADITALNVVHTGANSLVISDAVFSRVADGCGLVVIYDAGGPAAQIAVRDGDDLAFANFAPPLNATVPQVFTFPASTAVRSANLYYFAGSVEANRPNTIRVTIGGNAVDYPNLLNNNDGPLWDTVTIPVSIPAGVTTVSTEIISAGPGPNLPASLAWVTGTLAIQAAPGIERVSDSQKGSVLIFPKVELRWDSAGNLLQDTFIDLSNDYPGDVLVQMYFVNGDHSEYCGGPAAGEVGPGGDCHPGCNFVDVQIPLTQHQPTYWSAATGQSSHYGLTPFTVLDPGNPPGRPDPSVPGEWMLRGYIVAYAVNATGEEINWNHLKGDAMLINYDQASAWEYNAYAFQAHAGQTGMPTGTPGVLNLDGREFDALYDLLLLDFYGTQEIQAPPVRGVALLGAIDTDITLLPVDLDLRQETEGPTTTKATFTVWNQNEVKLTGMDLCVTCWDQRLASEYGVPNHFLRVNLQTDKGKAQIDGNASQLCNYDYDTDDGLPLGADPRDTLSRAAPFLGVAAKHAYFAGLNKTEVAGTTMTGMGTQAGIIRVDFIGTPPPEIVPGKGPARIHTKKTPVSVMPQLQE